MWTVGSNHRKEASSETRTRLGIWRRRVAAALAIAMLFGGMANLPARAQITIGTIGDQTGAANLDQAYGVLQQGVAGLKGKQLDIVLHVGDLIESTKSEAEIRTLFVQATTNLAGLGVPWYQTPGDHDVNPPIYQQNSTDRSRETLFKQLYGALNPVAAKNLYYSFDVKGYHIVVLDSVEHLHTDPRWGNVFYSRISDKQLHWLELDLAANTPGKIGTIVLMHQPLWYNWKGWSRVHGLLAFYKVKSVIAGHFHYNQVQVAIDGIDYRVVGSTGGTTKMGYQNSGDLYHVSVLKLDQRGGSSYTLIPLDGFNETGWTPKPIMDRIQALDQNLGNIFSFPQNSPVFLQNGKLVGACGATNPARLVLKNIGDAAAVPVTTKIEVTADGRTITFSPSGFGQGLCQVVNNANQCTLNPSAGVAVANTSQVEMSRYPPPPPLWTATIAASTPPPVVGVAISVSDAQTFVHKSQTYLVSKSGATSVQACN